MPPFALTAALAACIDYGLQDVTERPGAGRDQPAMPLPTEAGRHAVSACLSMDLPSLVPVDEGCGADPTGLLDPVVQWEAELVGYPDFNQVLMTPAVGQLTDDDGDGDRDADDVPDIVVVFDDDGGDGNLKGVIRVFAGDGSGQLWHAHNLVQSGVLTDIAPYRFTNVALGDVTGDGLPEIVLLLLGTAVPGGSGTGEPGEDPGEDNPVGPAPPDSNGDEGCQLGALDPTDGSVLWMSTASVTCGGSAPSLADLEGDGEVEVVVGAAIFRGKDGTLRARGAGGQGGHPAFPEVGLHSVVADLDGDGVQEIIAGPTIYGPTGQALCEVAGSPNDGYPAVADLDGDGLGEVVIVGDGRVRLFEHDCTERGSWGLLGGGNGGPPTIADFDGDGAPEVGVADAGTYSVYEASGWRLWTVPVSDQSSAVTGSVVYDFEGDAFPEVVYADEKRLWVLDGRNGAVRIDDTRHASRTLHEYPVVADVDGDGQAEIVVPNGGGHDGQEAFGLYVLESASGSWPLRRQVWNQHAFALTNINDDLTIPAHPAPNWPTYNTFRSGAPVAPAQSALPDAVPLTELCLLDCPARDEVTVAVAVGAGSVVGLPSDVPVALYDRNGVVVDVIWQEDRVLPGEVGQVFRVTLPGDRLPGGLLTVVVDDDGAAGTVAECTEGNNAWEVAGVWCR